MYIFIYVEKKSFIYCCLWLLPSRCSLSASFCLQGWSGRRGRSDICPVNNNKINDGIPKKRMGLYVRYGKSICVWSDAIWNGLLLGLDVLSHFVCVQYVQKAYGRHRRGGFILWLPIKARRLGLTNDYWPFPIFFFFVLHGTSCENVRMCLCLVVYTKGREEPRTESLIMWHEGTAPFPTSFSFNFGPSCVCVS